MSNQPTPEEIGAFVGEHWQEYLADSERLIAIDSSEDLSHAAPGAPFGPGPRAALDEILAIAQRFGLTVNDGDGYAGWAELPGTSGQQLGVIGHVDVVPAGTGWTFEPFALTKQDGILVGRGTSDDKMPLLCALYGLRFWLDKGSDLHHTVRFIFGCNEESGMAEIPYYLDHNKAPDFLFTPDADFPLCYGEKGLFGVTLSRSIEPGTIQEFEAGVATNAVPALATAVISVTANTLPAAEHITVESAGANQARIIAAGKSGHASMPEGTHNAAAILADYLLAANVCTPAETEWLEFLSAHAHSLQGEAAGVEAYDEDFKHLTSVVGTATKTSTTFTFTVDIRFPTSTTAEVLTEAYLKLAATHNATAEITRAQEPFKVNPDTAPVKALMRAYCDTTGQTVEPFTMGGATYAREFPNAVSFGAIEPGAFSIPEWVGGMHAANEGMVEEELKRAMRIYIRAFGNLAQVEDLQV